MREIGNSPRFSRDKFIPLQTKQRYSTRDMFNPSTGSTLACIQGPKVDISKAGNPQLVFWYYAYPGTDGKITVKVNRNDQEMKEVGTVDYNKLSGSIGWRSVSFDLAGVSNAGVENGYIRPYFYA